MPVITSAICESLQTQYTDVTCGADERGEVAKNLRLALKYYIDDKCIVFLRIVEARPLLPTRFEAGSGP